MVSGRGNCQGTGEFALEGGEQGIVLAITVSGGNVAPGPEATVIELHSQEINLSFYLRDTLVNDCPVYVPRCCLAASNNPAYKTYQDIVAAQAPLAASSEFAVRRQSPEMTFENAAAKDWQQKTSIWLGVPRDIRIFFFECAGEYTRTLTVTPRLHTTYLPTEKADAIGRMWLLELGHGISSQNEPWHRHLEEDVLPLPHLDYTEGAINYHGRFFTTLESSVLCEKNIAGTDASLAYAVMAGSDCAEEEKPVRKAELQKQLAEQEEVIFCAEVRATNLGKTAQYAWFKSPYQPRMLGSFDRSAGYMVRPDQTIGFAFRCNGKPAPLSEMCVLLAPGESVNFEVILPHDFISRERMDKIVSGFDFQARFVMAADFWRSLIADYGQLVIPEQPLSDIVRANIPNLEMACIGAAGKMVAATVGEYGPIGSESLALIKWFLSTGRFELARRSLEFFWWWQKDNGFIQTFTGYELETGGVLWGTAEYLEYTGDWEWARKLCPKIKLAAAYLRAWRQRSCTDEARRRGFYGLMDGQVADPVDKYHSFGLNAFFWSGLNGAAWILTRLQDEDAAEMTSFVAEYRENIREAFAASLARSPLAPFEDGTWSQLPPPWVEVPGATCLYPEAQDCFTHASFSARDFLVGAYYLVHAGVIDSREPLADALYNCLRAPYFPEAAALTQPYYSRHDVLLWGRDDVTSYLSMYYHQLCGLVDREIYTFFEHYFRCTSNKTHETGWFLMQTRWMFYREDGRELYFCRTMPRRWFEPGKTVAVRGMYSRFGRIDFEARLEGQVLQATVAVAGPVLPEAVHVRLPHPEGRKAVECIGGTYNPETETVTVTAFKGQVSLALRFG